MENSNTESRTSGTKFPWAWVGGGLIILVLLTIIAGRSWKWANGKHVDHDPLDFDPAKDNSPVIIKGDDYSRPPAEIIQEVSGASQTVADAILSISKKMSVPKAAVENVFGELLLAYPSAPEVRQAAFEAFMTSMDAWYGLYASAIASITKATSQIVADAMGINVSTSCARTVYIKNVETEQTAHTVTVNVTKNKRGCLGVGASSKQTSTVTTDETYKEKVVFVPYCEQWQVDPAKVAALMNEMYVGISGLYVSLQLVIDACPSILQYIPK